MVVILVLLTFAAFLVADWLVSTQSAKIYKVSRGTMITTPGFEMLGALAQDGGEKITEGNIKR